MDSLVVVANVIGIFILLVIVLRKQLTKNAELSQNPLSQDPPKNPIRAKIDFDNLFLNEKIIPTDLYVFGEEVISAITNFIRSISSTALDLHPIFDHMLIEQGGTYKYWTIANYSNISIWVRIFCTDKKGILIFDFSGQKSIFSDFNFEGEKTLLSSTYYMDDTCFNKRILKFSKEDLFNQREQPVLINVGLVDVRPLSAYIFGGEDKIKYETSYYDYFFFMDYLIKVDKTLGDLKEKIEIVKEFYLREKEFGRIHFEESWKKTMEELKEKAKEYEEENKQHRIPVNVKREVWRRDGGRCSRCGSGERLEFDHIIPYSKGGSNTARNIELLCQDCNRKKSNAI